MGIPLYVSQSEPRASECIIFTHEIIDRNCLDAVWEVCFLEIL